MFVVRLTVADRSEDDFKAFVRLEDARKRYDAACRAMPTDITAAVLFQVPGEDDVREAVGAVKAGDAIIVERDPWAAINKEVDAMIAEMIASGDAVPDA